MREDGDDAGATEFLLRFMEAGHDAGYPTAELEERVVLMAGQLGLEGAQVSATPTIVEASFGPLAQQRSFTLRVQPRGVELDAIARLDEVVANVMDEQCSVAEALDRVVAIEAHPFQRPWFVRLGAYVLAGAAVTPVLGGGWHELVAGAIVGGVVGGIVLAAKTSFRTGPLVAPVAAMAASFLSAFIAWLGLSAGPDLVTLAALVTLLPGMALTIGMREVATEHLQSGVANTANALVQLLGMVFGVGVGRSIAVSWFGVLQQQETTPNSTFSGLHVIAAVAAGLAFTVTLRAPRRAAPVMCVATVLAIVSNAAGNSVFGAPAGVFVAALAIGTVGEAVGTWLRRSPLVFIVPGVLILVPGSAGFNSLLQLLTGQTVSGINAGFSAFVTAMSIAYGLMVSTLLVPRRRRGVGAASRGR